MERETVKNEDESTAAASPPSGLAPLVFLKVVAEIKELLANAADIRLGARAIRWAPVWTLLQKMFTVRSMLQSNAHDQNNSAATIMRAWRNLQHPVQAWAAP